MTNEGIKYEDYERLIAGLAHKAFARISSSGTVVDVDDLKQEAVFCFLRAKELFDPSLNIKFSTYLYTAVRRYLKRRTDVRRDQLNNTTSMDLEILEGGGSLHDLIPSSIESAEETIDRDREAFSGLIDISPHARKAVMILNKPPIELAREIKRQQEFSKRCKSADYAAPVVKLNLRIICDILGYSAKTKRAVMMEARDIVRIVYDEN